MCMDFETYQVKYNLTAQHQQYCRKCRHDALTFHFVMHHVLIVDPFPTPRIRSNDPLILVCYFCNDSYANHFPIKLFNHQVWKMAWLGHLVAHPEIDERKNTLRTTDEMHSILCTATR